MKNIIVKSADADKRLDKWLKKQIANLQQSVIEKSLRKGQIRVNGNKAKSSYRVQVNDEILIPNLAEGKKNKKQEKKKEINYKGLDREVAKWVIYKNDDVLVLNKPHGVSVQGGSGVECSIDDLAEFLKFGNQQKPKLVHRIDKDTSGILMLARNDKAASNLTKAFKDQLIEKQYLAVVVGKPEQHRGIIDLAVEKVSEGQGKEKMHISDKGKNAITKYEIIDSAADKASLVNIYLLTGRKHQIRVHFDAIGNPILGDGKYGGSDAFIGNIGGKLHLHSREVVVPKGILGEQVKAKAPLPKHIQQTVDFFGFALPK